MVWYDYAVIKLATVFECSTAIGLTRKAYIFLLLCINTGTFNASISSPSTTTPGYSLTFANKGFSGACPFTINYPTEALACIPCFYLGVHWMPHAAWCTMHE